MASAILVRVAAAMVFMALLTLSILAPTVSGDCYTPDGNVDWSLQVCYDPIVGAMTSCCDTGDRCLTNKLCERRVHDPSGNDTYYRGTCSNSPDWSEDGCPRFCLGHTNEDLALSEWPVGKCPPTPGGEDRWFCIGNETGYGTLENCTDPNFGFSLPGGTSVYFTAGQLPTQAPVSTPQAPSSSQGMGTSTRMSWKAGTTSASSAASVPPSNQPSSTAVDDKSSATSDVDQPLATSAAAQPSSTSYDDHPSTATVGSSSLTSVNDRTSSASVNDMTSSTSVDEHPLTVPVATTDQASATPDNPAPPLVSSLTLNPSDSPTPHLTTATVHPSATLDLGNSPDSNSGGQQSKTVGIAVGTSIGGAVFLAIAFWTVLRIHRRRRRATPARAETPPPYDGPYEDPRYDAAHETK